MPLIKSKDAPALTAFSLADIQAQARALLARAKDQAELILAEARGRARELAEQARTQGYDQGFQEGLAAGHAQGRAAGQAEALAQRLEELQTAAAAFTTAATTLQQCRIRIEAQAMEHVIELALLLARKVTHRQAAGDPTVVAANLAQALGLVAAATDVTVAVHPRDRQALEAALPEIKAATRQLGHVQVVEDPDLAPGGCRVYMPGGRIDADLDAQLDRLAAELVPAPAQEA